MITVQNTIKIYENSGKEENEKVIIVHSHWKSTEMVDIELPGFNKLTVYAKDLIAAINNATNTGQKNQLLNEQKSYASRNCNLLTNKSRKFLQWYSGANETITGERL